MLLYKNSILLISFGSPQNYYGLVIVCQIKKKPIQFLFSFLLFVKISYRKHSIPSFFSVVVLQFLDAKNDTLDFKVTKTHTTLE